MWVHENYLSELTRWTAPMTNNQLKKISRRTALAAGLAATVAACSGGGSDTIPLTDGGFDTPTPEGDAPAPSGDAVDFGFESFDGEQVVFSEFSDRPVVLNFFASWCATCIAELPDFETVSNQLDAEVDFLGLATSDRAELSDELVEATGVTFDVGRDPTGEIFRIFGGLGMPTTVFINADGTVANVHTGVLNVESLTQTINEELL